MVDLATGWCGYRFSDGLQQRYVARAIGAYRH